MIISSIAGKPGRLTEYVATPREVFWQGRDKAMFIAGPITVDGTLSSNPQNASSTSALFACYLFAGMPVGKVTATGKYATSIIDTVATAYTSGGTSLTISAAGAAEIVRRIGSSGTFKTVGPPSANGTVATTTTTFSAVNTTTGVITVTSLGVNKVAGSLIMPTDGSETIVTLICDYPDAPRVCDQLGNRLDIFDPVLWAGGGVVNEAMIWPAWPTDTSIQTFIVNALRVNIPDAKFRYQLQNS